jgi:hypothetical protein
MSCWKKEGTQRAQRNWQKLSEGEGEEVRTCARGEGVEQRNGKNLGMTKFNNSIKC